MGRVFASSLMISRGSLSILNNSLSSKQLPNSLALFRQQNSDGTHPDKGRKLNVLCQYAMWSWALFIMGVTFLCVRIKIHNSFWSLLLNHFAVQCRVHSITVWNRVQAGSTEKWPNKAHPIHPRDGRPSGSIAGQTTSLPSSQASKIPLLFLNHYQRLFPSGNKRLGIAVSFFT